jgi:hypothetical protein
MPFLLPLMAAAKVAGGFIAKHWKLVAIIVGALALTALVYGRGVSNERAKWEKRQADAALAAAKETLRLVEKNYSITVAVTEVIEAERVVTRDILKKVNVYVPSDACPVDPGVRLLHDAAAAGKDPAAGPGTDAAPVEARALARTITLNYGRCRRDQARLVGLQEYVRDICQPDGLVMPADPPADLDEEPSGAPQ